MVHLGDDIVVSKTGKTMFQEQGTVGQMKFTEVLPPEEMNSLTIANWGSNNLLPQEMTADIEATGALFAGIEAKARIGNGKGPTPAKVVGTNKDGYEQLEFITDNKEINRFMELNNSSLESYNTLISLFGYGNAFVEILLSPDRSKIIAFKVHDSNECRLSKYDKKKHRITHVHICADWSSYSQSGGAKDEEGNIKTVPLLDRNYPLWDLQSRKTGTHFMMHLHYPLRGTKYYARSPWYSAIKYVKIVQSIPAMKEAMFANQATIKYLVNIHPKFWEKYDALYDNATIEGKKEIKERFYDDFEKNISGNENAYKSSFVPMVDCPVEKKTVPGFTIDVLDDKMKDGKMLVDSASGNIEILLPLQINSALLGVDMPGGGAYSGGSGSGSNIREAFLVQVMLQETERQMNNKIYNLIKHYNGWPEEIVFRNPNQILTTLNTGNNTQSTA